MATDSDSHTSLRDALQRDALREALQPRRPVFANPWDSTIDMFACYVAVAVIDPFLLWAGGNLMGSLFGFSPHWPLGIFLAGALVGGAGFMTIVGRQRTRLAVDVLVIAAWIVLGVIVAPIVGLAPSVAVALIIYAVMLAGIFGYVVRVGRFATAFLRTLSWPITWSLLSVLFAFSAYRLIYFV